MGGGQTQPQVTSFNVPADATPEQKQAIIMGMAQQTKQPQTNQPDPNQIMMLGALTKRPELVSYGQNLMKQGKAEEAKQNKQETAVTQLNSVNESITGIKNLLDNTNWLQRPTGFNYAGNFIPSSLPREMATYVDNLQSTLTLDINEKSSLVISSTDFKLKLYLFLEGQNQAISPLNSSKLIMLLCYKSYKILLVQEMFLRNLCFVLNHAHQQTF
jgi:hypothetical protein